MCSIPLMLQGGYLRYEIHTLVLQCICMHTSNVPYALLFLQCMTQTIEISNNTRNHGYWISTHRRIGDSSLPVFAACNTGWNAGATPMGEEGDKEE